MKFGYHMLQKWCRRVSWWRAMWSRGQGSTHRSDLMSPSTPKTEIGTLPLFPDKAASPSMMKHTMEIVRENTEFINAGQPPVFGADQPLYAICKQLQWQFTESLGEDKFVMKLGALHIEDKCQLMLGKMLRGSGWNICRARATTKSGPEFF